MKVKTDLVYEETADPLNY